MRAVLLLLMSSSFLYGMKEELSFDFENKIKLDEFTFEMMKKESIKDFEKFECPTNNGFFCLAKETSDQQESKKDYEINLGENQFAEILQNESVQLSLEKAIEATAHMHNEWLKLRLLIGQAAFMKLTKVTNIEMPKHVPGQSEEEFSKSFFEVNKDLDWKDKDLQKKYKEMRELLFAVVMTQRNKIKAISPILDNTYDSDQNYRKKYGKE